MRDGTKLAPKKSKPNTHGMKREIVSTMGIGIANARHTHPKIMMSSFDLLVWYPPLSDTTTPPKVIPVRGLKKAVKAK